MQNCRAVRTLEANIALNMAVSNLLSSGQKVMLMYGVDLGFFLINQSGSSLPEPLPAACLDPSSFASRCTFISTMAGILRLNISCHCFSRT
jgi:hypothetical protein